MGSGAITSFSRKQKINGKSSTEAELIGVDDALPQILLTRYFMESQGYTVKDNILYQDNKSAMLLEQNGKNSSSKRTKHIKVRYFFIQDKIDQGEIKVKYCLTDQMWSDILTKPLLGQQFKLMRAMVMNCPVDYEEANSPEKTTDHMMMYQNDSEKSSQECVGNDQDMLPMNVTTKDR